MPSSYVEYAGDGATVDFNVTFPYLDKSHVFVTVDTVAVSFTWFNSTTIRCAVAPGNLTVVKVYRSTVTTPLVDFTDGSTLTEADLDKATLQAIYIAEEAVDGVSEISIDYVGQAQAAQTAAEAAQALAEEWASNGEDVVVSGTAEYSAKHYSIKAAASAVAAALFDPSSYHTKTVQDATDAAQDAAIAAKVATADLASQAQAEAGVDNTKWMSPLRTKQAIDALAQFGGQVLNQQVFSASGTWNNAAAGAAGTYVYVELWGAGGGGGEAQAGGSTAEGGGGGQYVLAVFDRASFYENLGVTIGAGGAGAGASTGNGGGAGGDSYLFGGLEPNIANFVIAEGGDGGNGSTGSGGVNSPAATSTIFYAAQIAGVSEDREPPSAPNADGASKAKSGASGAGSQNTVAVTHVGGLCGYLSESGGNFDYTTGPTAGGIACGGAAGRSGQGGAAGGAGYCIITVIG